MVGQVEMGSKNHEVVPTSLIVQISGLRNGGVNKLIGSLAKRNLVSKVQNSKCECFMPSVMRIGGNESEVSRRWVQVDIRWVRLPRHACAVQARLDVLGWKSDRCREGVRYV